jgi:hypothetical protein
LAMPHLTCLIRQTAAATRYLIDPSQQYALPTSGIFFDPIFYLCFEGGHDEEAHSHNAR